jgi:hypothetical protein
VPLRKVAGGFDFTPTAVTTGRGRQALAPQDDAEAVLEWLDDIGLASMPEYWAIYEDVPDEALPAGAVKGAPGDDVVRPDPPATLARWQANRHMQEVATAWRPDLAPADAVEAWYRQGGTMQPLRWSDAQATEYASSLEAEARERGEPQRGQYVLYVAQGRGTSRRNRERGAAGSERRAQYNARRREQYTRRKERGK